MPRAFYAVSYEQTGLVLSYCELAKQDLSKAGAVAALLDQIVGDNLVLSFSFLLSAVSPDAIKIKKSQLNLDEVKVDDSSVADFTTTPYKFMLDLSDASAKAGDGTMKKLLDPAQMQLATPILFSGNPPNATDPKTTLSVQFSNDALATTKHYAIIDGQAQHTNVVGPPPANPINFSSSVSLPKNSWHTVVYASRGYQPFFGLLQAQ